MVITTANWLPVGAGGGGPSFKRGRSVLFPSGVNLGPWVRAYLQRREPLLRADQGDRAACCVNRPTAHPRQVGWKLCPPAPLGGEAALLLWGLPQKRGAAWGGEWEAAPGFLAASFDEGHKGSQPPWLVPGAVMEAAALLARLPGAPAVFTDCLWNKGQRTFKVFPIWSPACSPASWPCSTHPPDMQWAPPCAQHRADGPCEADTHSPCPRALRSSVFVHIWAVI